MYNVKKKKKKQRAVQDLSNKLAELRTKINQKLQEEIETVKRTQIRLSGRMLAVMRQYAIATAVEPLVSRNIHAYGMPSFINPHFSGLQPSERQLKQILKRLVDESRQLAHELRRLDEQLSSTSASGSTTVGTRALLPTEKMDTKAMERIYDFLKNQNQFIRHMTQTLETDFQDLKIIEEGINDEKEMLALPKI
ncbi:hypothetical protein RFI_13120 [Reticulomyxa filosa]|uniref:Uncharacterized protein n=1 Tax=Reticulomyxa filosa TaxID=46433 RepID=X6NDR4_RETFI|nr:hypothetical protein RFI_13120 [Reticulomyxa filosa]|eukprot:ETO24038.1 hypothetical protein RFI_13120 [Reticulomyxa filosa]